MKYKKIGFVIADDAEFAPIEKFANSLGEKAQVKHKDKFVTFNYGKYSIIAVLCGTGKVNAAGATAQLIAENSPDCIINFGLSGAVSGVYKNEVILGEKFIEHDFDLTPLGYKLGEKPGQEYIYTSDKTLNEMIFNAFPDIKPCICVCGDMFVAGKEMQKKIVDCFDGNCCDMETAAIASVCFKNEIPFTSIRLLSDSADDCAADSYRQKNSPDEDILLKIVLETLKKSE